jgi:hypothetical protein
MLPLRINAASSRHIGGTDVNLRGIRCYGLMLNLPKNTENGYNHYENVTGNNTETDSYCSQMKGFRHEN